MGNTLQFAKRVSIARSVHGDMQIITIGIEPSPRSEHLPELIIARVCGNEFMLGASIVRFDLEGQFDCPIGVHVVHFVPVLSIAPNVIGSEFPCCIDLLCHVRYPFVLSQILPRTVPRTGRGVCGQD